MNSSTGKINGANWQINGNGYAKFTHVDITGDNTSTLNWGSGNSKFIQMEVCMLILEIQVVGI